jgi:hypothetical protein
MLLLSENQVHDPAPANVLVNSAKNEGPELLEPAA